MDGRAAHDTTIEIDPAHFRSVLGQYPTGVSVVTGWHGEDEAAGLAVGTFTSVSLSPPLVAFCPANGSGSWPRMREFGRFCVNVLGADQVALCDRFAARGPDKFDGVLHRRSSHDLPILDGVIAAIECAIEAEHEAGDHHIVVGRVLALDTLRSAPPLLFYQGGYGTFQRLSAGA